MSSRLYFAVSEDQQLAVRLDRTRLSWCWWFVERRRLAPQ